MSKIDKELLKKRFEKSIETYAKNAVVQKQMADKLLLKLIEHKSVNFEKILEIGSGTGFLTKAILKNLVLDELFVNDIVEKSVNKLSGLSDKIKPLIGDCEKVEFPDKLNLMISNATFQWVENLGNLLKKIHNSLNDKGIVAFTTFGEKNFYQIKEITGKSLNYHSEESIKELLSKDFTILYSHSEIVELEFESVSDLLKHIKHSGVNALEQKRWTKKDLINFEESYKTFKNTDCKFVLTYHPLFFVIEKK